MITNNNKRIREIKLEAAREDGYPSPKIKRDYHEQKHFVACKEEKYRQEMIAQGYTLETMPPIKNGKTVRPSQRKYKQGDIFILSIDNFLGKTNIYLTDRMGTIQMDEKPFVFVGNPYTDIIINVTTDNYSQTYDQPIGKEIGSIQYDSQKQQIKVTPVCEDYNDCKLNIKQILKYAEHLNSKSSFSDTSEEDINHQQEDDYFEIIAQKYNTESISQSTTTSKNHPYALKAITLETKN